MAKKKAPEDFLDELLALRPRIAEVVPEMPDIIKAPLLNVDGALSHLADARKTAAALERP